MRHPSDQDLLLLAHNTLNPLKAVLMNMHIARCAECRKRYAEFGVVTSVAAAAIRGNMPIWKPLGLALQTKLLLGVLALSVAVLATEVVIQKLNEPASAASCASPPVAGPAKKKGIALKPMRRLPKPQK